MGSTMTGQHNTPLKVSSMPENIDIEYHYRVLTYVAASLSENATVKNYAISSNLCNVPGFNNIIIKVWYRRKRYPYVYLGQINHRSKPIDFSKEKHEISFYKQKIVDIIKTRDSNEVLQTVPDENIQFFFYSNKDLIQHDRINTNKKRITLPYSTDVDEIYKTTFPIKVSGDCYKFMAPANISYEDSLFLRKIRLFLNQSGNEQTLSDIGNLFENEFSIEMTRALVGNVHEYFRNSKATTITKDVFEIELLRTRLSRYIVKPKMAIEMKSEQARLWNEVTFNYDIVMIHPVENVESYLCGCLLQKLNDMCNSNFQWNELVVNENGKLSSNFNMNLFGSSSDKEKLRSWLGEPDTIGLLLEQMWRCDYVPLMLKIQGEIPFLAKYKHLGKKFLLIYNVEDKYEIMTTSGWKIFESVADIKYGEERSRILRNIHVSLQGRQPVSLEDVIDQNTKCMKELRSFQILHLIKKRKAYLEDRSFGKVEHMIVIKIVTEKKSEKCKVFGVDGNKNKNILISCYATNVETYTEIIKEHPMFRDYSYFLLQQDVNGLKYISGDIEKVKAFLVDEDGYHLLNSTSNEYVPIIGNTLGNYEREYISRSLHKPNVNPKIFQKEPRIYFLCGDLESLDTEIKNKIIRDAACLDQIKMKLSNKENILFDIREHSIEMWMQVLTDLDTPKESKSGRRKTRPILYIEVVKGKLKILQYRDCHDLNSYLTYDEYTISETIFFEEINLSHHHNNQITVISGNAGMGKTTLLHSLSKACDKRYYVIFFDLAEYRSYMKQSRKSECALDFVFSKYMGNESCYKNFLHAIYRYHKSIGKIILLIDSFDEVLSVSEEGLDFVKRIAKTEARIVIATRSMCTNMIINEIDVRPLKIANLKTYEVQTFLKSKKNVADVSRIPKEFLVNPLYLNFFIFISHKKILNFSDIDKVKLYDKVLSKKVKQYQHRIGIPHDLKIKSLDEDVLKIHQLMAMIVIFGEKWLAKQKIIKNYKKLVNRLNPQNLKLGLVKEFRGGFPVFIHQTVAEFLAAKWLSENLFQQENADNIFKRLLYKCDRNIKYFFDRMICKDLELHEAVLKGDLALVQDICGKNNTNIENVDKCGRNCLHLASEYCSGIESMDKCERNCCHFGVDYCSGKQRYKTMEVLVQHLLRRKYNFKTCDKYMKWNWFDYLKLNNDEYFKNICYYGLTMVLITCLKFEDQTIQPSNMDDMLTNLNFHTLVFSLQFNISLLRDYFEKATILAVDSGCLSIVCELIYLCCRSDPRLNVFLKVCENLCETTQIKNAEYINEFRFTDYNFTALHIACLHGHVPLVKQLLQLGADVTVTDYFERTALHYAVIQGSVEIICLLLKSTNVEAVNLKDGKGLTCFHLAVKFSKLNIIQLLLENGAIANSPIVLFIAARRGSVKICNFFLEIGTDVGYGTADLSSAFLDAAEAGNLDVLRLLLNHGANISHVDSYNNTALHLACSRGHDQIVEYLLKMSNDMSTFKNKWGDTPMDIAIREKKINIVEIFMRSEETIEKVEEIEHLANPRKNNEDYIILHLIKSAEKEKLRLLDDGITNRINAKTHNGETPLHVACRNGYDNIDEVLLLGNESTSMKFKSKQIPLHVAIQNGNLEITKLLLKYGANINSTNNFMETPLHLAVKNRNIELVKLLVNSGADIHQQNYNGKSPLHMAAKLVETYIAKILLSNNADVNQTDYCDISALHISVNYQNMETVKLLLAYGANINHADNTGNNALHIAVEHQNLNIVEVLLGNAAAASYVNNRGKSAVDIAATKQNVMIQKKLLQHCIATDNFMNCKESCLKIAVLEGDMQIAETILKMGTDINHPNNKGVLHIAAEQGKPDVIKLLLDKGANINEIDYNGEIALHVATICENLKVVQILLENGANVNHIGYHFYTPLHIALNLQNLVISEMLLKFNTNVRSDMTAFKIAINKRNVNILNMLMKYGLDIESLVKNHKFFEDQITIDFHNSAVKSLLYNGDRKKDVDFVKLLLENNIRVNIRSKYEPASNVTIKEENLNVAKLFLERGIDINLLKFNYHSALHIAIELENLSAVDLLIKAGIDINYVCFDKGSALHVAVYANNVHCVKLLLEERINVNLVNKKRGSALHVAIEKENVEIIKLLVKAGIDVNFINYDKGSPLHIATKLKNIEIVRLLLEEGVDRDIVNNNHKSALEIACDQKNIEIIEFLVKTDTNINRQYICKQTPLHVAIDAENLDLVKLLLQNGININILNCWKQSALHIAVGKENINIVKLLVEKGVDTNIISVHKQSALHIAVEKENVDNIKLLLEAAHIDTNIVNRREESALHIAIVKENTEIVKLLLKKGVNLDNVDRHNNSALHSAVEKENMTIIKLLVKAGVDINFVNFNKDSVLHIAVGKGNTDIVKLLLEEGVNIHLVNCHKKTALRIAIENKSTEIITLLNAV